MKILNLVVVLFFVVPAWAEALYGFGSVSVNYLDWTDKAEKRTENQAPKKDFVYLEIEGGQGFDWGDIYGFYDIENPGKPDNNSDGMGFRSAGKGMVSFNVLKTSWNVFLQAYHLATHEFQEMNRVVGLSYDLDIGAGVKFVPFVGYHHATTTVETPQSFADQKIAFEGFSGDNGVMLGWTGFWKTSTFGIDLDWVWWHETELGRAKAYGEDGVHKKSQGHNGAISFWKGIPDNFSAGLQYRYADHKLGAPAYQDAFILSIKRNL